MSKIHHLNCGTLCPQSALLINGTGSLFKRARMVCHCLLIEGSKGLILIDTGIGLHDIDAPGRLGPLMNEVIHPVYDRNETAIEQVKNLGFAPEDVRDIIVTHLDPDHAGGLADFPHATVHVHEEELKAALEKWAPSSLRYTARQWKHSVNWQTYTSEGERWFGFEAVKDLKGISEEILLIPLIGHTPGHSGIAVKVDGKWLLHCGDAYFFYKQIQGWFPESPPALGLFQLVDQWNLLSWTKNLFRLRELYQKHREEIAIFCSHDPVELDSFLAQTL